MILHLTTALEDIWIGSADGWTVSVRRPVGDNPSRSASWQVSAEPHSDGGVHA
jgi:hypothetical protein